jgi:hypothetical protein
VVAGGNKSSSSGGGCLALFLVIVAIALVVMGIISLAALIDPFNWMPRVGVIWKDCSGDCALAHRFPGFWLHAILNLVYAVVATVLSGVFLMSVADLREKRVDRFDSTEAATQFTATQNECLGAGALLGATAVLPIVVAIF